MSSYSVNVSKIRFLDFRPSDRPTVRPCVRPPARPPARPNVRRPIDIVHACGFVRPSSVTDMQNKYRADHYNIHVIQSRPVLPTCKLSNTLSDTILSLLQAVHSPRLTATSVSLVKAVQFD